MILTFKIQDHYFFIRVDEKTRELAGAGVSTGYEFVKLKSLVAQEELSQYAEVERLVNEQKDLEGVYEYVMAEFKKKGYSFIGYTKDEDYQKALEAAR